MKRFLDTYFFKFLLKILLRFLIKFNVAGGKCFRNTVPLYFYLDIVSNFQTINMKVIHINIKK